ncbi:MAG TPA: aldo/keto reductase [Anaerohalosphaeraceae bacterium]|jgi:alcohol dehydrogenase (NADP+)|nr:aldo/keto reductase [Anaerohalosphaeraceae bacterium]HRT49019.1 aldo/keto reductase [Anaerohalosphaeraceae bacterium]HRT85142.1 aldo/keto reductase [Anaerohalosphaeraceae bacterium]
MEKFTLAPDGVDPAKVPTRTLYSGARIPAIGLGTFGSDRFTADQVAAAVRGAIAVGYRHIDCASVYGNEPQIGAVLQEVLDSGAVKREDLWITSKVWNDMHGKGDVLLSCARSLRDLRLDYLDLYLVHWPFPNYHAPGCDVTSRSPDARPYIHDEFMSTWRQMERLVEMGLVRHIGTSNMTIPKMELLLRDAKIKPACNEMELHPHFQQPEFFRYCMDHHIQPIGFCPVGSPTRPDRDKTETDTVDIEDPVVKRIAARLGVHPAVVCVKWAVQRGQIPIPFSVHRNEYLSNLQCTVSPPLTDDDMNALGQIDKNCRLIKGQVFLWKEGQSWEDLWDVDGHITPP